MTKNEFLNSKQQFHREIGRALMAWFILWIVPFFWVGASFRYWFHRHPIISDTFLVGGILVFLVPVWFIARFLHERHNLVCRTCGQWLFSDPSVISTGKCSKCQSVIIQDA